MELPEGFEQETVILFDHRALEKLVKETWGKEYDTGAALDRPYNGSYFEYKIDEEYEGEYITEEGEWVEDGGYYTLERVIERLDHPDRVYGTPGPEDVLVALVEIGKLPKGKYILHFWW